jgi:hypothetical protein
MELILHMIFIMPLHKCFMNYSMTAMIAFTIASVE